MTDPWATLVVDASIDESDGDYSEGDLSLREAIYLASLDPGHTTIQFDSGLTQIVLDDKADTDPRPNSSYSGSALVIDSDLTIEGHGSDQFDIVVSLSNQVRAVFAVENHVEATFSGLNLTPDEGRTISFSEYGFYSWGGQLELTDVTHTGFFYRRIGLNLAGRVDPGVDDEITVVASGTGEIIFQQTIDGESNTLFQAEAPSPDTFIPITNLASYGPNNSHWSYELMTGDGNDSVDLQNAPEAVPILGSIVVDTGGGDDRVIGSPFADIVRGGSGDDTLFGGGGNDRLSGEDGDDFVHGGGGRDSVSGGEGDDVLRVRGRRNHLTVSASDDAVNISLENHRTTGEGTDILIGRFNQVLLEGNHLDNAISTEEWTQGAVSIRGNRGDDTIWGTRFGDSIDGGDGDDVLLGFGGNDQLAGGHGDDLLDGGVGFDQLAGGRGDDILRAIGQTILHEQLDARPVFETPVLIDNGALTPFSSVFTGSGTRMVPFESNPYDVTVTDTGVSGYGEDTIEAAISEIIVEVNPAIFFTSTAEEYDYDGWRIDASATTLPIQITGSRDNDEIIGGQGPSNLNGGEGDDLLTAGSGQATLDGGAGDDVIFGSEQADRIDGSAGNDYISSLGGDDFVYGGNGDDTAVGGFGNDSLSGGSGADVLLGSAGHDRIRGGDGDDFLRGNGGRDRLIGELGEDRYAGTEAEIDDIFGDTETMGLPPFMAF